MAPRPKLNDNQLAVLRWIAGGSPAGVMEGYGHRVSAAALRTRGLIKISGRSTTWRARITPAGAAALEIEPASGASAAVGHSGAPARPRAATAAAKRPARQVSVPGDLRGAHPLVTATRKATIGVRPERDGRVRIGPRRGVAHIQVSRPLLRRALLILHGLTKEAVTQGWQVVPYPDDREGGRRGIAIEVRGHRYPVEVHELTKPLPLSQEEITAWRRHTRHGHDGRLSETPPPSMRRRRPTVRLRLVLPDGYRGGRTTWSDGPRGLLETKLPSVLRTLKLRAEADDAAAIERTQRFADLQREQKARDERARRELIEAARLERLLAEVETWRRSEEIRAYVAALEERLPTLDRAEQPRIARWCEWARERADQADPTRHASLVLGLDDA